MEEFSCTLAKSGKPLCTRNGKEARIICYDSEDGYGYPVVALIRDNLGHEIVSHHDLQGRSNYNREEDLFINIDKKIIYPETWDSYLTILFSEKGQEYKTIIEDYIQEISHCNEDLANFYKIILLRDYYRQGWLPNEFNTGYSIRCQWNEIIKEDSSHSEDYLISFQSFELRDKFYYNFYQLIKKAKEYIR